MKPTFFLVVTHGTQNGDERHRRLQCVLLPQQLHPLVVATLTPNSECHSVLSTPFINGAVSEGVVENEADVSATLSSTRPHTPGHITTVGAWTCSRKPRLPKNAFT